MSLENGESGGDGPQAGKCAKQKEVLVAPRRGSREPVSLAGLRSYVTESPIWDHDLIHTPY